MNISINISIKYILLLLILGELSFCLFYWKCSFAKIKVGFSWASDPCWNHEIVIQVLQVGGWSVADHKAQWRESTVPTRWLLREPEISGAVFWGDSFITPQHLHTNFTQFFSSLDFSGWSLPTSPNNRHSVSLLKTQLSIGNKDRLFTSHIWLGISVPKVVWRRSSFPPRCVMNILSALFQENKKTQVWQNNVIFLWIRYSIARCQTALLFFFFFHDQGVKVWLVSMTQLAPVGRFSNYMIQMNKAGHKKKNYLSTSHRTALRWMGMLTNSFQKVS